MKLSKNDDIKLNIDSLTSEGSGIGRFDGFAVFVSGVVPGDEVVAHIIKCSKNYAIGVVKDIIKPSKFRIESDCPVSSKCGGCSFRNVSYDEELRYKKGRVQDALERIGKLDIEVEEIIGADKCSHYRNNLFQFATVNFLPVFMLIRATELFAMMIAHCNQRNLKQGLKLLEFGWKKQTLPLMMKIRAKGFCVTFISERALLQAR